VRAIQGPSYHCVRTLHECDRRTTDVQTGLFNEAYILTVYRLHWFVVAIYIICSSTVIRCSSMCLVVYVHQLSGHCDYQRRSIIIKCYFHDALKSTFHDRIVAAEVLCNVTAKIN